MKRPEIRTIAKFARTMRFASLLLVLLMSPPIACGQSGYIVGWGASSLQQTIAPAGVSNVIAVAAGGAHSVTLKSDGTVVAWGYNSNGQTNIPPWLSNVVAIAAFNTHTYALRDDGTVATSGDPYGQGGFGIIPGLSNAVRIAAGTAHLVALRDDGTVFCWGDNVYGQLNVPAGLTNVVSVAAGYWHSLALRNDGSVVFWGLNHHGLGNLPPDLTNVTAIAAGYLHNLGLKSDGTVVAWGAGSFVSNPPDGNNYGQSIVPSGTSNIIAIAAGGYDSLIVNSNGSVLVWGDYLAGQTNVPPGLAYPLAVSVGASFVLTTIAPQAPFFLATPTNVTAITGTRVDLAAQAFGAPLPQYRWQLNGTNLPKGTNAILSLNPVRKTNAEVYTVTISNQWQSITSPEFNLIVIPFLRSPQFDGVNFVVSWPDTFILQTATNGATGSFFDLLDATSPYTNAISAPQQFFRLRD